jgi:hypothetical protein
VAEAIEIALGIIITLPLWAVLYHVLWRPWLRR